MNQVRILFYIAIAFTSIAALVGACSYWDDISYALCDVVKPELNNGECGSLMMKVKAIP